MGNLSIKVIVADDDIMVREGMKIILSLDKEIEVVGTCANGDEAFQFCINNSVDVVLMDIRMPICDGVLGTKKICETCSKVKILILTTFNDDEYIVEALKNGASGYLLKNIPPEEVIKAVKIVNEGNMIIHPSIAAKVPSLLKMEEKMDFSKYDIQPVEKDIMRLISEGYSNKEIAEKIFLSQGTVKNKITDILSKLNLRDRTQIAIFYLKGGKI